MQTDRGEDHMSLRDVHDRCIQCGRPPSEECCEKCPHPQEVNTEAVNQ